MTTDGPVQSRRRAAFASALAGAPQASNRPLGTGAGAERGRSRRRVAWDRNPPTAPPPTHAKARRAPTAGSGPSVAVGACAPTCREILARIELHPHQHREHHPGRGPAGRRRLALSRPARRTSPQHGRRQRDQREQQIAAGAGANSMASVGRPPQSARSGRVQQDRAHRRRPGTVRSTGPPRAPPLRSGGRTRPWPGPVRPWTGLAGPGRGAAPPPPRALRPHGPVQAGPRAVGLDGRQHQQAHERQDQPHASIRHPPRTAPSSSVGGESASRRPQAAERAGHRTDGQRPRERLERVDLEGQPRPRTPAAAGTRW